MADCSQLQSALTQVIQARQDLDDPNYCADNFDTITEQELCRERLPKQKREADQEIARLQRDIGLCDVLIERGILINGQVYDGVIAPPPTWSAVKRL